MAKTKTASKLGRRANALDQFATTPLGGMANAGERPSARGRQPMKKLIAVTCEIEGFNCPNTAYYPAAGLRPVQVLCDGCADGIADCSRPFALAHVPALAQAIDASGIAKVFRATADALQKLAAAPCHDRRALRSRRRAMSTVIQLAMKAASGATELQV